MRNIVRLHKWCGVAIAVWVIAQALTGMAMLYRAELNRLLHPGVMTVERTGPPLAVDRWIEAAQRAVPGANVERIDYPSVSGDAVLVTMQCGNCGGRRLVTVNPYSAEVTSSGGLARFPVEAAFWLHSNLWVPPAGKYVVGALGLIVVVMAGSGLWMWWPRRSAFVRALRILRSAGRLRLVLDLHRVPGALTSVAVLYVASTGVLLSYSAGLTAMLKPVLPFADGPRLGAQVPAAPRVGDVESLVAAARAEFPASVVRDVRWTSAREDVLRVLLRPGQESIPRATEQVLVRRADAAVLAIVDPAKLPAGDRSIRWLLPLHSGEFGGALGNVVSLIAAFGLLGSAITGLWMWSARRAYRAQAALRAASAHRSA